MKVRIYQPHTHAGKRYTPGPEGIDVDMPDHAIAWLRQNNPKVLERPVPAAPAAAPAPTAPKA